MKCTILERCKTTLACQKRRARTKYGVDITYTAEDLAAIVPPACRWCEKKLTPAVINFDHKTALARGGQWTLENLEAICATCNRRKGALNTDEYKSLLQKLDELAAELNDPFIIKNVLMRMGAGSAFIYG
jgi:HNH endonuclease